MEERSVEQILAEITPVKIKDLPAFLQACEPIFGALASGNLASVLSEHLEELLTVTTIGAGVERSWLEEQTVDVLASLVMGVVEANLDFFVQGLLPRLTAVTEQLNNVTASLGGTNS